MLDRALNTSLVYSVKLRNTYSNLIERLQNSASFQKIKSLIKDSLSKCEQIYKKLRTCSHLLIFDGKFCTSH